MWVFIVAIFLYVCAQISLLTWYEQYNMYKTNLKEVCSDLDMQSVQ